MLSQISKIILILFLVAAASLVGIWYLAPSLIPLKPFKITENVVRETIITQLRSETPMAFLITGALELSADITEENTKYFFPEYFDDRFSLGTTRSNVRLPGRVTYGVNLQDIDSTHISLENDSLIIIRFDEIEIQSVEADLESMQVMTEVGWARLHSRSGQAVEKLAMIEATNALRVQAGQYIQTNAQPLNNTEQALSDMLKPVLQSLGIQNPVVKCQIVPAIVEPIEMD